MKNINQIKYLKIASILIFLIITFSNDKMYVPFGFLLINSIVFVFVDFFKGIIPLLALFGLSIILLIKINDLKSKIKIMIAYAFTYLFLAKIIVNKQFYVYDNDQLYFYISSIIYIIISLYVLLRILHLEYNDKTI